MEPDFTQLYSQLNLSPDCSLDEFKRAYRRRISELHPDRRGTNAAPSLDTQNLLRELISLYAAALRFNRLHGRLPGGTARAVKARPVADMRRTYSTRSPSARSVRPPVRRGRAISILLIALLVTLLLSWYWSTPTEQAPSPPAFRFSGPMTRVIVTRDRLELGMDKDAVLAIQGEPLQKRDTEWDYGPSWLKFEQDRLVDWYSSPLYRLKTATVSARADAANDPRQGPIQPVNPATRQFEH